MYGRPAIENNDKMDAGGLKIEVVQPFEHLKRPTYDGKVCLLDDPRQMADPRQARSRTTRWCACAVQLDFRGMSPMYGGRPVHEDGTEVEIDAGEASPRRTTSSTSR